MKKIFFYVSLLAVLFSVVSCGSNDDDRIRKEIIGSFRYSNINENGALQVTVTGVETFGEDGTVEDESIILLTVSQEGIGDISVTYRMNYAGEYKIEDSHIVYDYSNLENDGNIELLSSEGSEGTEELIEELTAQLESSLIPAFVERFAEANRTPIDELNEKQLVVLNPQGEKIVKERIADND